MDNKQKIIQMLEQQNGHLSGEQISAQLGVSRAAVWKCIAMLKSEGYEIECLQSKGYILKSLPSGINAYSVASNLKSKALGRELIILEETDSTNIYIKKLAAKGSPHGTVAIAKRQNAGLGRLGRIWVDSTYENLYMSILLRPQIPPSKAPCLTIITAVGVMQAIRELGIDCLIKWPNDIMINNKKLCGILTQMAASMEIMEYAVIGIGINCNTPNFSEDLAKTASSLMIEKGAKIDVSLLAANVLNNCDALFEQYFSSCEMKPILEQYKKHSHTLFKQVRISCIDSIVEGIVEDFDEMGMILLRKPDGSLITIAAGDVSLRNKEIL